MKFENNPACQQAVEELASNGQFNNVQIIEALKNEYPVQDIQIALGNLFTGKNKGFFRASGKTEQVI